MSKNWPLVVLALAGIALGVLIGIWQRAPEPPVNQLAAANAGQSLEALPEFTFLALDGQQHHSDEWAGKIRVVNFWATWCPPCREETPLFVQLQEEFANQNVQFLGIAIDEIDQVREFAELFNINYPILIGDQDAIDLSRNLGNRFGGLPFTVISDREGNIVTQHTGGLREDKLRPLLEELISR